MGNTISILAMLLLLSCAKNKADPNSDEHGEDDRPQPARQEEPIQNTDPWDQAGTPAIPDSVTVEERVRSLIFEDGIRMDYDGDTAGDGNGAGNTDDEEICRQEELDGELLGVCMALASPRSITCQVDDAAQPDCDDVYSELGEDFECESTDVNGDPALSCSDGWAIVANGEAGRSKTICRVLLSNQSGRCLNAYKEEDDGMGTLIPVATEELILDMQQSSWQGYNSGHGANPSQAFDSDPPLSPYPLTDLLEGATLTYKTLDSSLCTVDNDQDDDNGVRGTLTLVGSAPDVCNVVLTIEAEGYADRIFSYDIELVQDNDSAWTGYGIELAAAPFDGTFYIGETLSPDPITGSLSSPQSTYQSEDESICSVDGDTGDVTGVAEGTCIVNRIVSQSGYLDKRIPTAITVDPLRTYQGMTWAGFPEDGDNTVGETTSTLSVPAPVPSAIGMDSYTIEWESGDCTWVGGSTRTITFLNTTPCTLTVTIEKRGYADLVQDFVVVPALGAQSGMSWSPRQNAGTVGVDLLMDPFNVTLSNNETVSYVVSDAGNTECSFLGIDGEEAHTLTFENSGTCIVQAVVSRSGYEDWNSPEVSISVALGSISVGSWESYEGVLRDATADPPEPTDIEPSDAIKSYASNTESECTVDPNSGVVSGISPGNDNCTIALTLSRTGYRNRVNTYTFSVWTDVTELSWSGYSAESISIADAATPPSLVAPISSTPGVLFAYQTTDTACNVNAGTGALTILTAGTCTVTLTAYANNYRSIRKNVVLTITKVPQNALSAGDAAAVYGADPILSVGATLSVDGMATLPTAGTGALTYDPNDENVCTTDAAGTVTGAGVGTCVISLYFAGDDSTEASNALEILNIEVEQGAQTFTPWSDPYGAAPRMKVNGNNLRIKNPAPDDHGHGNLEYSSLDTSVCTVNTQTGEISPVGGGDCTVQARYTGTDNYQASDFTDLVVISVRKFLQPNLVAPTDPYGTTLTLTVGVDTLTVDNPPDAGLSPIEYRPLNGDETFCLVEAASGEVTPVTAGSCVVEARFSETPEYHPSPYITIATIAVSEGDLSGVLSWSPATTGEVGAPLLLDPVDGIENGDTVTYTVVSGNCSFDTGSEEALRTLSFTAVGTCTINASVTRTGYANWMSPDIDINADPGTQVLTPPTNPYGDPPILTITAGDLPIVSPPPPGQGALFYRSLTTDECTVNENDGTISPVATGECVIEAQYIGTSDYLASDFVEILRITVGP